MTYQEILDSIKNLIDETDEDTQIDVIIKSAVDEAYTELCKVDKRLTTAYIPIIRGVASIPNDCDSIINITPELTSKDKTIGNSIITTTTGTFEILYSYIREPLSDLTEEPDLNLKLHFAICLYACGVYNMYKKRTDIANNFFNQYEKKKYEFESSQYFANLEEVVRNVYDEGDDE